MRPISISFAGAWGRIACFGGWLSEACMQVDMFVVGEGECCSNDMDVY